MKRDEKAAWRQKTIAELDRLLQEKQRQLVAARFQLAQGKLKDVHLPAKIRDQIAVIKSIMTEKRRENG